ncbi:MAG: threonine ammonia-lyase [Nocardioidaceae bacterium]
MPAQTPITVEDIQAARTLLEGVAVTTPVEESRWLSTALGAPVSLKCENLQRAGSFKIRGAYVRISRLSDAERARGVVAASAGNHAQGVALAASLLGTESTVFMPEGAPIPKESATRAYGADVRFAGPNVESALEAAREFSDRTGAVLIHPFDHRDVVAGQGTLGLELVEQVPELATVVVSVGGGGLVAGIATALHALRPDVRVVGVQAERVAAYPESLRVGHPVSVEGRSTMADGIAISRPGDVPFPAIAEYVDEVLTVTEEAMSQALLMLLERAKLVVEPAGAASVAALLSHPDDIVDDRGTIVPILTGGNIDPLLLLRVVRHGLASAGRYMTFRARIPDRPGSLNRLLSDLAEMEVNVLDVVHERTSAALHVDEVGVLLQVETRGETHRARVEERLRERGYALVLHDL